MKFYFILYLFFVGASCNQSKPKRLGTSNADSAVVKNEFKTIDQIEEEGKRFRDTNYFYLDHLLDTVLKTAKENQDKSKFNGEIDTSVFNFKKMYAAYQFGNIFSAGKKHLIIKRFINEYFETETSLYSDIYLFENNSFKKVASDTSDNGYYEDTLMDANDDGYKDFMISSYSHAGCCPRSSDHAYIYNSQNGYFEFEDFFNWETGSTGKIFFETDYGQAGLISLYKYRWAGMRKVLLEAIEPTHAGDSMFSFAKPYTYTVINPKGKKQILKDVPDEYKKLRIFEYFISYQEK